MLTSISSIGAADGTAGAGAAGAGAVMSYSGTQRSQVVVSLLI